MLTWFQAEILAAVGAAVQSGRVEPLETALLRAEQAGLSSHSDFCRAQETLQAFRNKQVKYSWHADAWWWGGGVSACGCVGALTRLTVAGGCCCSRVCHCIAGDGCAAGCAAAG